MTNTTNLTNWIGLQMGMSDDCILTLESTIDDMETNALILAALDGTASETSKTSKHYILDVRERASKLRAWGASGRSYADLACDALIRVQALRDEFKF